MNELITQYHGSYLITSLFEFWKCVFFECSFSPMLLISMWLCLRNSHPLLSCKFTTSAAVLSGFLLLPYPLHGPWVSCVVTCNPDCVFASKFPKKGQMFWTFRSSEAPWIRSSFPAFHTEPEYVLALRDSEVIKWSYKLMRIPFLITQCP